jgi:hypothetical protein
MMLVAALLAAASLGLAQPPYLGVACPQPNVTACGRIGIGIWLDRPALGVEAVFAGVTVQLRRRSRFWSGFVRADLGLPTYWTRSKPVSLQLTIRYPDRIARGTVTATLHPGWG